MDISESIEYSVSNYFRQWFAAHPYLAWIIAHPLPSLGLLVLTIFTLWGLIKAIGRGIEHTWLFLLTTPFRLFQPIFNASWRSILRLFGHTKDIGDILDSQVLSNPPAQRIETIVDRLQQLHSEQELLLRELSTLTDSTPVSPKLDRTSDTQYQNMYAKLLKLNSK
jgi:hypothetical protein